MANKEIRHDALECSINPEGSVVKELMRFGVKGADLDYAASLFSRFKDGSTSHLSIGGNFWPSALMTGEERTKHLGVVDYSRELKGKQEYLEAASSAILIAHPMDAGLATNVNRLDYLKMHWLRMGRKGEPQQGAKGTDLCFEVDFPDLYFEVEIPSSADKSSKTTRSLISIMELKYLRLIQEADKYAKTIVRPIVSIESMKAVRDFFGITYLPDRLDPKSKKKERTYGEVLSDTPKIALGEIVIQNDLPTVDLTTRQITTVRKAPGGHGQIGSIVLHEIEGDITDAGEQSIVRAIYNGDGVNNSVSPEMVGFMVKKKAGIIMLSTTKTGVDIKGGIIGIENLEGSRGQMRSAQLFELAQARKSKQETTFYNVGLDTSKLPEALHSIHEPGQQYFNTNVVLINKTLLSPFLKRLKNNMGEEEFAKIITPDLIENEKEQDGRKFVQLEGALGSVVLNLNRFVTNSEEAKNLWKEISGSDQFLRIINLSVEERTDFFTPIKYAFEFWLQAYSDHFVINPATWRLENARPSHLPNVSDSLVQNPYYMDLQNVVEAFGHAKTLELDDLDIKGNVKLKDAVLRGKVEITSEYNVVFDLNSPAIKDSIGTTDTGTLLLENVSIFISQDGEVTVTLL